MSLIESNVLISLTSVDDEQADDSPVLWHDSPTKNDIVNTKSKQKNLTIMKHYKNFLNVENIADEKCLVY